MFLHMVLLFAHGAVICIWCIDAVICLWCCYLHMAQQCCYLHMVLLSAYGAVICRWLVVWKSTRRWLLTYRTYNQATFFIVSVPPVTSFAGFLHLYIKLMCVCFWCVILFVMALFNLPCCSCVNMMINFSLPEHFFTEVTA